MPSKTIAVTYTGREDPFVERNYGSALTFETGQTRALPPELAEKLLRHADVFERAEALQEQEPPATALAEAVIAALAEKTEGEIDAVLDQKDDTEAQLALAEKEKAEKEAALNERQNVVDQVNLMDKDALKEYAQNRYGQPLPKTMAVETMRSKVVGMIDQFGIV